MYLEHIHPKPKIIKKAIWVTPELYVKLLYEADILAKNLGRIPKMYEVIDFLIKEKGKDNV